MKIFHVTVKEISGEIIQKGFTAAKSQGNAAERFIRGLMLQSCIITTVKFAYDDEIYDASYFRHRPIY